MRGRGWDQVATGIVLPNPDPNPHPHPHPEQVRQYEPTVPEEVAAHVVDEYVAMRTGSAAASGFGFTTARTLLAILRLSQALARLHQRHEVRVGVRVSTSGTR